MKQTKQPIISVVVPAYNEEKLIRNCLESLFSQQFSRPFEVIVVNNNSTDRTLDIAKKFPCRIVNETRQGVAYAKQAGIMSARGRYVAFLDADSIAPKNWLRRKYTHLCKPGVVATTGFYNISSGPWYHRFHLFVSYRVVKIASSINGQAAYVAGSNVAFDRQTALNFGGLNIGLGTGADEVELRHQLRQYGHVLFDPHDIVITSDRRSNGGFFNFYRQIIVNYCLNIALYRLLGKKIISDYTNFR